jgi:hypothetical protein
MSVKETSAIFKDDKHDHYWIEDEILFESYWTIRGLRYRSLLEVKGMKDNENCSEEVISEIAKKYKN